MRRMNVYIAMKIIFIVFIFCAFKSICLGQIAVPYAFLERTLEIKYQNTLGSSFLYVNSDSNTYLITARHIFKNSFNRVDSKGRHYIFDTLLIKSGDTITLSVFSDKWNVTKTPIYFENSEVDIAVLKINSSLSEKEFELYGGGLLFGQDCFFIGYPMNIQNKLHGNNVISHTIPFVNKAILSNVDGSHKISYLTGQNTYGYSGGPVVFYDYDKKKWFIYAVVSGYLKQTNTYLNYTGHNESTEENSGIMVVYNIEEVKKIIATIPHKGP
jgi:hypothetical protein